MKIDELYQLTTEGVHDPAIFHAVFMAGSPGSGKSTIAGKLFVNTGLRELNVDRFWDLFHLMGKDKEYDKFYQLAGKQKSNWLEGRLGLLVDGTARDLNAMREVKSELEGLGYETAMVFVNTDLDTALERVAGRKTSTGRDVSEEYVINSWKSVQSNLGSLQTMFAGNFYIIDNTGSLPDLSYVNKKMRKWLSQPARTPEAHQWINSQIGRNYAASRN